jgi:hypothetical protein
MELEIPMLSEVSQVQKGKDHIFSHMWKTDPKDKHMHKTKHNHIHLYIEHVCNSGIIIWNSGEEGKEKRMMESTILKYTASMQVDT